MKKKRRSRIYRELILQNRISNTLLNDIRYYFLIIESEYN